MFFTSAAWGVQTETVKIVPTGGGADENYGDKVAIDGNTIVGGAYMASSEGGVAEAGAVYVHEGGAATWTQKQRISPEVYGRMSYNAIGLEGDTMVVGAYKSNTAYVYDRVGSTWSLSQTLTGTVKSYGNCVALQGGTMAVADPDAASGGVLGVGQIDIYAYDGTSWGRVQTLDPSDPVTSDNFGKRIDIEGDRLITGAYSTDNGGVTDCGAAYIFEKQGGVWTQTARLVAGDAAASQYFGYDVALQGDTVIVGACQDSEKGSRAGAAYVFKYDGTTWNQTQKLLASDAARQEKFGAAVDFGGQTAIIGACSVDGPGAVYVFAETVSGAWSEVNKLAASDAAAGDRFGYDAAFDVDTGTAVVGAYSNDNANGANAGAAYVFTNITIPRIGDANCDGTVDEDDAAALAANWLKQSGATWAMGDFNGDQKVDDVDATMMAANWGSGAAANVPEPSAALLTLIGALTMLACACLRRLPGQTFGKE